MEKLFNIGDLDLIRDIPAEIEALMKSNKTLKKALILVGTIGLLGFGIWIYREFAIYDNDERGKSIF